MPALKQSSSGKFTTTVKRGNVSCSVKTVAGSSLAQAPKVEKGKTSAASMEAVRSNAERHREAMIRLANR